MWMSRLSKSRQLGTFGFLPPLPGVGATRRQATSITSEKADIAGLDETLV